MYEGGLQQEKVNFPNFLIICLSKINVQQNNLTH